MGTKYDIFLSYSRRDGTDVADAIIHSLEARGLTVFRDQSVVSGDAILARVESVLAGARAIICLLAPSATESKFMQKEIGYALRRQTTVIPVVLDRKALDSPIGSLLGDRLHIDASRMSPDVVAAEVTRALEQHGFVTSMSGGPMQSKRSRRWVLLVFAATLSVALALFEIRSDRTDPSRMAAQIRRGTAPTQMKHVDLSGTSLEGVNVTNFEFSDAILRAVDLTRGVAAQAHFDRAQMAEARLSGLRAPSASFVGTVLVAADIRAADLRGADLRGADLRVADLRGANLSGANLTGADLEAAKLTDARFNTATKWPEGFLPIERGAVCVDCQ